MGVTPASWHATAICAAVSTPIVLCSMSRKAKSKPHAARMRPMSTVRAWRRPMPRQSCPAASRSLALLGIAPSAIASVLDGRSAAVGVGPGLGGHLARVEPVDVLDEVVGDEVGGLDLLLDHAPLEEEVGVLV